MRRGHRLPVNPQAQDLAAEEERNLTAINSLDKVSERFEKRFSPKDSGDIE